MLTEEQEESLRLETQEEFDEWSDSALANLFNRAIEIMDRGIVIVDLALIEFQVASAIAQKRGLHRLN